MKLGIIIPTYNSENTLVRCLESLKVKNLDNEIDLKVVVIDDGSTDNTKKILSEYQEKNIISKTIYLKSNRGISVVRNLGILECKDSEYISFLDSDDCIDIKFINECFKKIKSLGYNMIVGSYEILNESGNIDKYNHFKTDKLLNRENKELLKYLDLYLSQPNRYSLFSYCWGRVYSMKIINENLLKFNEKMHTFEDVDFNFRYLILSKEIYFINTNSYTHYLDKKNLLEKSSTFGRNNKIYNMFSFIWAVKNCGLLYSKLDSLNNINLLKKMHHCCGSYFIIQFIRITGRINSLNSLFFIRKNMKKLLKHNIFNNIMNRYDYKLAKGSYLIFFLIKKRFYILALIYGLFLFNKRYKK